MAGILDSVNQRTQLVGQNRLELLLFRLDSHHGWSLLQVLVPAFQRLSFAADTAKKSRH